MTVSPGIAEAHARAVERLVSVRGSIRAAFDALDSGVTFDDLVLYVERDFHVAAVYDAASLDAAKARLVGLIAGAALTIVESDRARRGAS